ncbi:MAG: hypothetical protein EBQ51_03725 [Verrucomicrobia bacterium]|nr:hypothetical protein [Verrucomicrobiota bacterium]
MYFSGLGGSCENLSFSIADGIVPGNEGRNYVLRRILRRAVMFGRRFQLPDGFLSELVTPLIRTMGDAFPELKGGRKRFGRFFRRRRPRSRKRWRGVWRCLRSY